MDSKNIFERSSGKKTAYYIVAGVCVAVIALLSLLSYNSMKEKPKEQKTPTSDTDQVDNKKDDIIQKEPINTVTPEPEPEPEVTPEPEIKPEKEQESSVTVKAKPYIMPVEGKITVDFSLTTPIYSKTLGDWRVHDGIDISAEKGAEVVAVNDGVIEDIHADDLFGVTVTVKHTDGKKSVYSNLEDSVELEKGQIIEQGNIIGKVGETAIFEISDGPHLHFEMSDSGQKINPSEILTKK